MQQLSALPCKRGRNSYNKKAEAKARGFQSRSRTPSSLMTDYTDDQLLAMALGNLGDYIHENSPQYILIEKDPRNEDDYDTWGYGTEPLPHDHTWQSTAITVDVSPSDANMAEQVDATDLKSVDLWS